MSKDIAIGILAYNVSPYIANIIKEVADLDIDFIVINDYSSDDTLQQLSELQKIFKFEIINNLKNVGAGESTRKLIKHSYAKGYKFFIKIDGDGQFAITDIKKIIEIYKSGSYEFIKSNRFWDDGIKGNIPKKRFFGNLFATMLLQLTTGTNKIFDPLNGLFGVSTKIIHKLDKHYPKRYGYPFYITVTAIIYSYQTYQINNQITYGDQKSNLSPIKVLFTLLKLFLFFYIKKINVKKKIGNFQRSAFFDIMFLSNIFVNIFIFLLLVLALNSSIITFVNPRTLLFLLLIFVFINFLILTISFKEEKFIRQSYIDNEK